MRRAPDIVIGSADSPYLRRWYLIPHNRVVNVYLHQFVRSDDDRALHDHPWSNISILLRGSYFEHTRDGQKLLRRPWRPWAPWRLVIRRPSTAHRVELLSVATVDSSRELPCWSLFITGPKVREWGFLCPWGWRHWRDFSTGERGETLGRGCD